MANKYEDKAGLNVNNHYGARAVGGTEGVTRTDGVSNEFLQDLDESNLDFGFPVTNGTAYVTEADVSLAGGTITAIEIGGVDVIAATPEAPVQIPAANTGEIVLTGGDGTGKYLIGYKKYPL
tara:strand:- start:35120 stop:35485 length:366 start_codon:yes stop_codon:yes gene_type:complete